MAESLAKFRICFAQGLLRIDFQKPGKVDEHEQQIAELAFQFRGRSILPRVGQLVKFFVEFFENLIGILPIEANRRRFRTDVLRLD